MKLIAEVKTCSPYGYKAEKSLTEQLDLAAKYGDFISVHTDPGWGGSFELLTKVAQSSWGYNGFGRNILAKGIHRTDAEVNKAIRAGASCVLVVNRLPHYDLLKYCWLEPQTLEQFVQWQGLGVPLVWNRRDLSTGMPKSTSLNEVIAHKQDDTELIMASYYRHEKDVPEEAWGVLVGEHLEQYIESMNHEKI